MNLKIICVLIFNADQIFRCFAEPHIFQLLFFFDSQIDKQECT